MTASAFVNGLVLVGKMVVARFEISCLVAFIRAKDDDGIAY